MIHTTLNIAFNCHTRSFFSSRCWHKTLVTYFVAVCLDNCNQILHRPTDEAISTPWKNVMTDGIKVGKYMMREIKLHTVK
jgi:hypothetical protein